MIAMSANDRAALLGDAREAHRARDWPRARELFALAASLGELSADDLDAWADSAWWLGRVDESMQAGEWAHRLFVTEGRPDRAASAAAGVAVNLLLRGDTAAGSGWVGRAQRLLADLPEGAQHGYMRYMLEVEGGLDGPDLDSVITAARQISELGRRLGESTLAAVGVLGEGRALVRQGRVEEGMAALDEAMVAVLSGELPPDWAGNIYCHLIAACYELADLRRAHQWVVATERWLETLPAAVVFTGICRVHRSQLLQIRGAWDAAEREATRVCDEVSDVHVSTAAEAHYTIGEIRRLRNDLPGADAAYQMAHRMGRDPQPGVALLRLAQGRGIAAAASIRAALVAETTNRLTRARLCAAQVEIALAVGDAATARKAVDELAETAETFRSPGLVAATDHARGAVLLAAGHAGEALGALRAACRRWRELDAPHEVARVRLLLAGAYRALGDADAAEREAAEARAELDRLGATSGPRRLPDRLTEREVEVLALVAAGRTNRQIATALAIAEKTVARHLSNIFTKIGAGSRTEAAAYAFEHGLAAPATRG
jgi:DNA-binding NarL/FixJ family response regulator